MTLAGVTVGAIIILADLFIRGMWFSSGSRRRSSEGGGQAQLVILVISIALAILAPFLAQILYFATSRQREYLADANATLGSGADPRNANKPLVLMQMTGDGEDLFETITARYIQRDLAIVLDKTVKFAPRIQSRIAGGRAQIEGVPTMEKARDLSIVLRAGQLPTPLTIAESRTIGPSLGADSIQKGGKATLLGLSLVLVWRRSDELRVLLLAALLAVLAVAGTWFNPLWEWAGHWLREYTAAPYLGLAADLLSFLLYGGGLLPGQKFQE